MAIDVNFGYWLDRNHRNTAGVLTGLAPMFEIHETTTMQDIDPDLMDSSMNPIGRFDILNLTAGLVAELNQAWWIHAAGTLPTKGFPDRGFDAEFLLHAERRF